MKIKWSCELDKLSLMFLLGQRRTVELHYGIHSQYITLNRKLLPHCMQYWTDLRSATFQNRGPEANHMSLELDGNILGVLKTGPAFPYMQTIRVDFNEPVFEFRGEGYVKGLPN